MNLRDSSDSIVPVWVSKINSPKTFSSETIISEKDKERFWIRVNKTEGCWEWKGYKSKRGYGAFGHRNMVQRVHRFSYYLHFGIIPLGKEVCHKCDNPGCVRPDHLFLGSHLDNMADMMRKGRWTPPEIHPSITHPECVVRGEEVHTAKLTEEQVIQIRKLHADGVMSKRAIARLYSHIVSRVSVNAAISRKSWKHL